MINNQGLPNKTKQTQTNIKPNRQNNKDKQKHTHRRKLVFCCLSQSQQTVVTGSKQSRAQLNKTHYLALSRIYLSVHKENLKCSKYQ